MSKPFYCEYVCEVPRDRFPFSGSLRGDTLEELQRERDAFIKLAKERGAKSIFFRGIAETRVNYHGKFDDIPDLTKHTE